MRHVDQIQKIHDQPVASLPTIPAAAPPPPAMHKIGGLDVAFPHAPYGVQYVFMGKMIQALKGGQGTNALLEVREA